jgi:hypothetical protein
VTKQLAEVMRVADEHDRSLRREANLWARSGAVVSTRIAGLHRAPS